MKAAQQIFFIGLALSLILTSCSVEKRVYFSGYNVEWKNNKNKLAENKTVDKHRETTTERSFYTSANSSDVVETSSPANNIKGSIMRTSAKGEENRIRISASITKSKIAEKKAIKKAIVKNIISKKEKRDDDEKILLYILCLLIPPVAVGIATDWDTQKVVINLILTILCWLPGVIHAFMVVSGKVK